MNLTTLLGLTCSLFLPFTLFSQSLTYNGNVTDTQTQEPLIGVNILVKNTSKGTLTDVDGNFSISASPSDTISLSYLGYQTLDLILGTETSLSVTLFTDEKLLEEIVVVGYGTIKKSDLTGAIGSVKSEDIVKVPGVNPMQALQGKVAGLQILSTSGDPGADPVVRLRGLTTLNNNNPIAVIDGVITDISAAALLNANDIESVEILKDASASAIYGARGAAGVVIITTKKGVSGKTRVNFSLEQSFENVANKIDVMNGTEFATYINQISPGTYNNLDLLEDTDWQDLIYNENTPMTNANFSVSGGSENSNFYFGLGAFNQNGILPKSGLQRLTGKLNSSFNVSKNVTIGVDLSLLLSDKDNAPGVVNTALRAWPIDQPYLPDGVTFAEVNGGNPIAAIEYSNSRKKLLRSLGNLYASISFLNDFTFKSSLQFDLAKGSIRSFTPKYFVAPLQQNEMSDLSVREENDNSLIFENTLSYNKSLGKHSINAVVGYTAQDTRNEFLQGTTEGLVREDELFWYLNAGQNDFETASNNFSRSTLLSYLGRINYTYDSRYLLTASFRRDGSSKFGPNNKYGNFPSVAVGWNASNEPFFPQNTLLNRLKIRASWGIIGNEKINGSAQYALITPGADAVFGSNEDIAPGVTFSGGGNPNLKWEETTQTNVGMDIGLWEDRLTLELDYYIKTTADILVPLEPIGYTGIGSFQSIVFNAANVRNSGLEWNVNYRQKVGDLNFGLGILGTTIKNEVTNIGQGFGADSLLIGGDLGNGQQVSRTAVGQPIGFFYGYEVIGVFQNADEVAASPTLFGQAAGDLKFRDVNNDGVINTLDRTVIGKSIPDLIFGFNLNVGWKNLSLSADFQGQLGSDIYNGKQAIRFTTLNYEDKYNNFWDGEGSTNIDHRASLGGVNFLPSSYFVEDGSFLRLRTLSLSYAFSKSFLQRLKIAQSSIYVRATNLFTATSYTGYSPEIGASNAIDGVIDRGVYPITKTITFGINVNF